MLSGKQKVYRQQDDLPAIIANRIVSLTKNCTCDKLKIWVPFVQETHQNQTLVYSPFGLLFADSTLCHVLTSKNIYELSKLDGLFSFLIVTLTFNQPDVQLLKIKDNLEKYDSVKTASHLILARQYCRNPNTVHNTSVKNKYFFNRGIMGLFQSTSQTLKLQEKFTKHSGNLPSPLRDFFRSTCL